MDSCDDDLFNLSDDDLPAITTSCNPVEEHLTKKLSDVRNRIERTSSDIEEIRETTERVLKSLHSQAQYGKDITSESDNDLYTIEGQPVIKNQKSPVHNRSQILVTKGTWKRILCDKWIIGVVLQNTSTETLCNLRFYVDVKDEDEVCGTSMVWYLENETFWHKTDRITPRGEVIATVGLDLPNFDRSSFSEAFGTISYEIDETEYQTPVPAIRLSAEDMIDNSYGLKFSTSVECSILALKTTSVEKVVGIQLEGCPGKGASLLEFLEEKCFKETSADVYVVKATGSLMYCLVEILPIVEGEARLRISSRSSAQMNLVLRLLRDTFPDMCIKGDDNCAHAAMALIHELQLYLQDGSASEKQRARIKTDLLIP